MHELSKILKLQNGYLYLKIIFKYKATEQLTFIEKLNANTALSLMDSLILVSACIHFLKMLQNIYHIVLS